MPLRDLVSRLERHVLLKEDRPSEFDSVCHRLRLSILDDNHELIDLLDPSGPGREQLVLSIWGFRDDLLLIDRISFLH